MAHRWHAFALFLSIVVGIASATPFEQFPPERRSINGDLPFHFGRALSPFEDVRADTITAPARVRNMKGPPKDDIFMNRSSNDEDDEDECSGKGKGKGGSDSKTSKQSKDCTHYTTKTSKSSKKSAPSMAPTPNPDRTDETEDTELPEDQPVCGRQNNNELCPHDNECCSQHGWCGSSMEHCGEGCQSGACSSTGPDEEPVCGRQNNNELCPNNECCSQHGWCGSSMEHCGEGCQSGACSSTDPDRSDENEDSQLPPDPVCGTQSNGDLCPNDECCSQYGWCGSSIEFCGFGCQSGACTSTYPNEHPVCGRHNNGDLCPNNECCSLYGWCGSSIEFCGDGCQSGACSSTDPDRSDENEDSQLPPDPTEDGGKCLPDNTCEDASQCCSMYGYCGSGFGYCSQDACRGGPCWDPGYEPSYEDGGFCLSDKTCENESLCCSQWGYCGSGNAYCAEDICVGGPCYSTDPDPSEDGGQCLPDNTCEDGSQCCSKYGYCGSGFGYCSDNACRGGPCWDPGYEPSYEDGGYCLANNTCANDSLCCSQWGYCGNSSGYCAEEVCVGGPCWGAPSEAPSDTPSSSPAPSQSPSQSSVPSNPPTPQDDGTLSRVIDKVPMNGVGRGSGLGVFTECREPDDEISNEDIEGTSEVMVDFQYAIGTSPDSNLEDVLLYLENEIHTHLVNDKLDCSLVRMRRRRLESCPPKAIATSPEEVVDDSLTCSGEDAVGDGDCHIINGGFGVFISDGCAFFNDLEVTQEYLRWVKTKMEDPSFIANVPGATGVYYRGPTLPGDESRVVGNYVDSAAIQENGDNDENKISGLGVFFIAFACVGAVVSIALVARKRKHQKASDERELLKSPSSVYDIEDMGQQSDEATHSTFTASAEKVVVLNDDEDEAGNAEEDNGVCPVQVHHCTSALCEICSGNAAPIKFISPDSPDERTKNDDMVREYLAPDTVEF